MGLSLLALVVAGTPQPGAAAVIEPVITITSGKPPSPVTAYEPYPTHIFEASGGTAPYTLALRFGSLPTGMSVASGSRKLAGTPTTPGSYTFGIRIVDADGFYADQEVTVVVVAPKIKITSGTPTSPWFTNQPYPTHTFTASGGHAPYSVALRSGSLPIGMALSSVSARLSGTPVTPGSYTFGVRVLDANGFYADQEVTVVIADPAAAITSGTPKQGTVGKAYSFTFTADGDSNIAFSVSAGNLPPGLTLAAGGVLKGTPRTAGRFGFTVKATGTATSAEKEVTLVVDPRPTQPVPPGASPVASAEASASASAEVSASADAIAITDPSPGGGGGELRNTGGNTSMAYFLAGVVIIAGGLLLVMGRRIWRRRATE